MIRKVLDNSDLISKASVRWSMIGIFVVNAMITGVFAVNGEIRDRAVEANTARTEANTARTHALQIRADKNTASLQKALTTQCTDRNTAAVGTNAVLDSLLEAVNATKSLPPAEKAERVALYNSVKVPIINCAIEVAPSQYKVAERPTPAAFDAIIIKLFGS